MLRIMPRQKVYFDCFEKCAHAGVEASVVLREMLKAPDQFPAFVTKVEALERLGDEATTAVQAALNDNLAPPFDRSDIRALVETLDDVVDGIDTVAHKLVIFHAQKVRPEAHELAEILARLAPALERAVAALRTSRTAEGVLAHCREVHQLETDADKVLRRGLGALFGELTDAIELIKWKEILELLEHATDKCEDAVRIIEEVVRQHA